MTLAVSLSFVGPIGSLKKAAVIDDLHTDQSGAVTNLPPAPDTRPYSATLPCQ